MLLVHKSLPEMIKESAAKKQGLLNIADTLLPLVSKLNDLTEHLGDQYLTNQLIELSNKIEELDKKDKTRA